NPGRDCLGLERPHVEPALEIRSAGNCALVRDLGLAAGLASRSPWGLCGHGRRIHFRALRNPRPPAAGDYAAFAAEARDAGSVFICDTVGPLTERGVHAASTHALKNVSL